MDEGHEALIDADRQLLNDSVELSVLGMAPRDQRKRGKMKERYSFPVTDLVVFALFVRTRQSQKTKTKDVTAQHDIGQMTGRET